MMNIFNDDIVVTCSCCYRWSNNTIWAATTTTRQSDGSRRWDRADTSHSFHVALLPYHAHAAWHPPHCVVVICSCCYRWSNNTIWAATTTTRQSDSSRRWDRADTSHSVHVALLPYHAHAAWHPPHCVVIARRHRGPGENIKIHYSKWNVDQLHSLSINVVIPLRDAGTVFCWILKAHINCYKFMIFMLCILTRPP